MAGTITFPLSPTVLEWARKSMGFTIEQAAEKAGVSPEKFQAWEKGDRLPTYKQLENLAENVYKRPLAILLLKEPPIEHEIQKDFRSLSNQEISNLSPELRLALRKARRYQLILEEVSLSDRSAKYEEFKVATSDNPITSAKKFRDFLKFPLEEQVSWKPESALLNFKRKVESVGIYIFQLKLPMPECRGFCLIGDFPVVVLNKDDSKNGRIFSIFHEVCHILFNQNDIFKDRQTGSLNIDYQKIENFCNQFAASFLVPEDAFDVNIRNLNLQKDRVGDAIFLKLSQAYNVSNEVIARKFLARHLISEELFWSKKRLWDSQAKRAKEKENERLKDSDPQGINQGIKIISDKGRPYVYSVVTAYQQGLISSSDLSNYLETKFTNLVKIIERLNS
jgi:Zn-dependent peptidase ImmA (M78 family)/DNA-binding XRE family transcriptional regulator